MEPVGLANTRISTDDSVQESPRSLMRINDREVFGHIWSVKIILVILKPSGYVVASSGFPLSN